MERSPEVSKSPFTKKSSLQSFEISSNSLKGMQYKQVNLFQLLNNHPSTQRGLLQSVLLSKRATSRDSGKEQPDLINLAENSKIVI